MRGNFIAAVLLKPPLRRLSLVIVFLVIIGICLPPAYAGRDKELMKAAAAGRTAAIKRLIKKGARINASDESGLTPLMQASVSGSVRAARLLIRKGAKVVIDEMGCSPLEYASRGLLDAMNEGDQEKQRRINEAAPVIMQLIKEKKG